MTPAASDRLAILQMLLVVVFWGAFFVFGKIAVAEAGPMAVAALRFLVAAALMAGLLAWREPAAFRLRRRDMPLALALAATGVFGYNALAFYGFSLAPASDGAIISPTLNPVLTAAFAALWLHEPLTRHKVAGLVLSVVGVGLIFAGPLLLATGTPGRWLGDLLFVLSAFTWCAYTLLGKVAGARFSAVASTTYATILGALMLVPFAWGDLARLDWAGLSWRFWGAIAFMAAFCTVAAFMLWYSAIRAVGASRASSFLFLVPIVGVGLGAAMLGERPGPIQLLGMGVAIAGVAVANRRPRSAS